MEQGPGRLHEGLPRGRQHRRRGRRRQRAVVVERQGPRIGAQGLDTARSGQRCGDRGVRAGGHRQGPSVEGPPRPQRPGRGGRGHHECGDHRRRARPDTRRWHDYRCEARQAGVGAETGCRRGIGLGQCPPRLYAQINHSFAHRTAQHAHSPHGLGITDMQPEEATLRGRARGRCLGGALLLPETLAPSVAGGPGVATAPREMRGCPSIAQVAMTPPPSRGLR
mmetsp:Transcript_98406/g.275589  ORF Transcript_98406/g.275589 Transcript_98406/m.275589 type:complete len:223 (+) Transcript_98406:578-1246(+)